MSKTVAKAMAKSRAKVAANGDGAHLSPASYQDDGPLGSEDNPAAVRAAIAATEAAALARQPGEDADVVTLSPKVVTRPNHTQSPNGQKATTNCHPVTLSPQEKDNIPARITFKPFPVELLPQRLRDVVTNGAMAIGCDPSMVAIPGLCALASAIGASRAAEIKPGWREPSILWGAVIADPSTGKSPAFDLAKNPIEKAHRKNLQDHKEEVKRLRDTPEEAKAAGYGKGQSPPCKRVMVEDITLDAVAPILRDNPRGVLVACEELDGWFQSFTRYAAGGATDMPRWLKLYGGRTLTVDRKGSGMISVPHAFASICGTIQPGVFAKVMTAQVLESGLAARFLLGKPPARSPKWNLFHVPKEVEDEYDNLIQSLLLIPLELFEDGNTRTVGVPLSHDSLEAYAAYYDQLSESADEANDSYIRSVIGKFRGTAARLALVCALSDSPEPGTVLEIGIEATRRGIGLANWFEGEIRRIYLEVTDTPEGKYRHDTIEYIRRKGGTIDIRTFQRRYQKKYPTRDLAKLALDVLVGEGYGQWTDGKTFRLRDPVPEG